MRLKRDTPPDDPSMIIAVDEFGALILHNGEKAIYPVRPGICEPDPEALVGAVLAACHLIWPDDTAASYRAVFDADANRLRRHLPPIKILKVLAWAATHDNPAEMGAALVAAAKGVDAVDLMAAGKAFQYAKLK